jgi:hypothetical protein
MLDSISTGRMKGMMRLPSSESVFPLAPLSYLVLRGAQKSVHWFQRVAHGERDKASAVAGDEAGSDFNVAPKQASSQAAKLQGSDWYECTSLNTPRFFCDDSALNEYIASVAWHTLATDANPNAISSTMPTLPGYQKDPTYVKAEPNVNRSVLKKSPTLLPGRFDYRITESDLLEHPICYSMSTYRGYDSGGHSPPGSRNGTDDMQLPDREGSDSIVTSLEYTTTGSLGGLAEPNSRGPPNTDVDALNPLLAAGIPDVSLQGILMKDGTTSSSTIPDESCTHV